MQTITAIGLGAAKPELLRGPPLGRLAAHWDDVWDAKRR
jgi:hypothetical protein